RQPPVDDEPEARPRDRERERERGKKREPRRDRERGRGREERRPGLAAKPGDAEEVSPGPPPRERDREPQRDRGRERNRERERGRERERPDQSIRGRRDRSQPPRRFGEGLGNSYEEGPSPESGAATPMRAPTPQEDEPPPGPLEAPKATDSGWPEASGRDW